MRIHGMAAAALSLVVTMVAGGCVVNVDLATSPESVLVGQPVTFDVKVSDESACPVGQVTALLFPFIPKDTFINRIQDSHVREALREIVDAFCTGRDMQLPPGASARCELVHGDLVCTLNTDSVGTVGALEPSPLFTTSDGDEVTCEGAGTAIVCRIPWSIVESGLTVAASTNVPEGGFVCVPIDGRVVCYTPKLNAGAMQSAQIELAPGTPGVLRNWIIAIAGRDEGVCKTGTAGVPCENDTDCVGVGNSCGSGICVGGGKDGFGCDADGECPGGDCVPCGPQDGQVLPGLECTTTAAAGPAPAMAPWALSAAGLGLAGIAGIRLHRSRRR